MGEHPGTLHVFQYISNGRLMTKKASTSRVRRERFLFHGKGSNVFTQESLFSEYFTDVLLMKFNEFTREFNYRNLLRIKIIKINIFASYLNLFKVVN